MKMQKKLKRKIFILKRRYRLWRQWLSSYEAKKNSKIKNICVLLNIGDTFTFDIYRSTWRDLV